MAKSDDKFPTRTGTAVGSALESRMIKAVGGADGIRTEQWTLPNGSTTRMHTRLGHPDFYNEPVEDEEDEFLLYFRLVSELHPYGFEKLIVSAAEPSAQWEWPDHPVSYSRITTTPAIKPAPFAHTDGPGTCNWFDSRPSGERVFTNLLTWSPPYGVGRSSTRYGHQILQQAWYDHAHPELTDYPPQHTHTIGGQTFEAGTFFPGQEWAWGTDGLRTVESVSDTRLYDNGVDTGIAGDIHAACKVATPEGNIYRVITGAYELLDYASDGTLLSSSTFSADFGESISYRSQGFDRLRFNSSGTQACTIMAFRYPSKPPEVRVVLFDVETMLYTYGPTYGVSGQVSDITYSQGGSSFFSTTWWQMVGGGDVAYTFTQTNKLANLHDCDYRGDALQVVWAQIETVAVGSAESHLCEIGGENYTYPTYVNLTNPADNIASSVWEWVETKTGKLYVNDAVIAQESSSATVSGGYEYSLTSEQTPGPQYRIIDATGVGSLSVTGGDYYFGIGSVRADLRLGVVLFGIERIANYSPTTSYTAAFGWNENIVHNFVRTDVSRAAHGEVHMSHELRIALSGADGVYSGVTTRVAFDANVSVQAQATAAEAFTQNNLPDTLTINLKQLQHVALDPAMDQAYTTGFVGYGAYNNYVYGHRELSYIDAISFAVDKRRSVAIVSGLRPTALPYGAEYGTPYATIGGELENFVAFTKAIFLKEGARVADVPIVPFGNLANWPAKVWIMEPMFLPRKVTPP